MVFASHNLLCAKSPLVGIKVWWELQKINAWPAGCREMSIVQGNEDWWLGSMGRDWTLLSGHLSVSGYFLPAFVSCTLSIDTLVRKKLNRNAFIWCGTWVVLLRDDHTPLLLKFTYFHVMKARKGQKLRVQITGMTENLPGMWNRFFFFFCRSAPGGGRKSPEWDNRALEKDKAWSYIQNLVLFELWPLLDLDMTSATTIIIYDGPLSSLAILHMLGEPGDHLSEEATSSIQPLGALPHQQNKRLVPLKPYSAWAMPHTGTVLWHSFKWDSTCERAWR